MRIRPPRVLPLFAYGLAAAMGCAGAGSPKVTGAAGKGGSTSGAAGTSSGGMAGTSSSGSSGTSGSAGTTGSAGSTTPGTGGMGAGAAGTTGSGAVGGGGIGGVSSTAGTTGAAGTGLVTGMAGTVGAAGTGGGCQMAKITYEPKIPTVYILVDRSGSMFDCLTTTTNVEPMCGANNQGSPMDTSWYKLKEATRSVLKNLEHDVHFGFATIWGQNPMPTSAGGVCPPLQGMVPQKVAPKEDNADEIMTMYDSLAFQPNTTEQGKKFETPASETLQIIGDELVALTSPGDKYILFITDGQPDYCDDSNSLCAPDSVVGHIQRLKSMNITTIVMGLKANINDLPMGILQAFANAGAGEPTVAPLRGTGTTTDFYDQCNSSAAGWKADRIFLGKPDERGTTLGTYATTAGPTMPFSPSAADQTQIVTQLSQALAGVKSCSFDLSDVGGKMIKVDTTKLTQAHVLIQGTEVPLDTTNTMGWNVEASAPTTLVFSGAACTKWRMPSSTMIDLQFPCGSIIFE